jgi:hypothetical protein
MTINFLYTEYVHGEAGMPSHRAVEVVASRLRVSDHYIRERLVERPA